MNLRLTARILFFALLASSFSMLSANGITASLGTSSLQASEAGISGQSPQEQWRQFYNTGTPPFTEVYHDSPLILTDEGEVHYGAEKVNLYFDQQRDQLDAFEAVHPIHSELAHKNVVYEIGYVLGSDFRRYYYLNIRKEEEGKAIREFDYLVEGEPTELSMDEIQGAREEWVNLCNQNNAANLVGQMYLPDAVYYHHEPPVIGTDAIIEEYQYMNKESYKIELTPLVVVAANQNTVLEIGQGSRSFNGKYVLVWKRTENGWKVLFDSNV